MAEQQWIVYDERANPVNGCDDANVLECCDTEREARRCGQRGYIWRYDVRKHEGEKRYELINEEYVGPTRALSVRHD